MPDEEEPVGPVDFDVLDRIGARLSGSSRFERVSFRPAVAPNSVLATYDTGYLPAAIEVARLRVIWFETDDFHVHYSEQYSSGEQWECRWDRHPNAHNTRAHFHPPPDAATPGEDTEYATDWRELLSTVLTELDDRIEGFWD